jgi:hypothetical protein
MAWRKTDFSNDCWTGMARLASAMFHIEVRNRRRKGAKISNFRIVQQLPKTL